MLDTQEQEIGRRTMLPRALLAVSLFTGCASPPHIAKPKPPAVHTSAPAPPPRLEPVAKSCPTEPTESRPKLCALATGEMFLRLPEGHGWERGRWVELFSERPQRTTLAVARVSAVLEGGVELAPMVQLDAILSGAYARLLGNAERQGFGKYIGRVVRTEAKRVRIDIGAADGVSLGDVYSLRLSGPDEHPIGRVRVTNVEAESAWAEPQDPGMEIEEGQPAVYLHDEEEGRIVLKPKILVLGLHGADKAIAEAFAKRLAAELDKTPEIIDVDVSFDLDTQINPSKSEEDGHEAASKLGVVRGVEFVIWGSARRGRDVVIEPRYTIVSKQVIWGCSSTDIDVAIGKQGLRWKGDELGGLSSTILGELAYAGDRYGDAAYFFKDAFRKNAPTGTGALFVGSNLAEALYREEQRAAARREAWKAWIAAGRADDLRFVTRARVLLAQMDREEGHREGAHKHLEFAQEWCDDHDEEWVCRTALKNLAQLALDEDRPQDAMDHYLKMSELARAALDFADMAEASYGSGVAAMRLHDDEVARKCIEVALQITRRLRRRERRVATMLHTLAALDATLGRVDDARAEYQEAILIHRRLGNVKGETLALDDLAMLEVTQGKPEGAREAYQKSMLLWLRMGDVAAAITTQRALARVEYTALRMRKEGLSTLEDALRRALEIGDPMQEVLCLELRGDFELELLNFEGARAYYEQALKAEDKLEAPSGVSLALDKLTTIEQKVSEARAAYSTELSQGGVVVLFVGIDSSAARAGIENGDILIRVGPKHIADASAVAALVEKVSPKQTVNIERVRGKTKRTVQVHGGPLGIPWMGELPPKPKPKR